MTSPVILNQCTLRRKKWEQQTGFSCDKNRKLPQAWKHWWLQTYFSKLHVSSLKAEKKHWHQMPYSTWLVWQEFCENTGTLRLTAGRQRMSGVTRYIDRRLCVVTGLTGSKEFGFPALNVIGRRFVQSPSKTPFPTFPMSFPHSVWSMRLLYQLPILRSLT